MNRPWRKPSSRAPPTPVRACLSPWIALPFCLIALLFLIHLHLYHLPSLLLLLPPLSSTKPPGDPKQPAHPNRIRPPASCDFSRGRWARGHRPLHYNASCPFHRNAWNCLRNGREDMDSINSWVWAPDDCGRRRNDGIDPAAFLETMRGRRIGLVGDSLNENFLVAFLCILRSADGGARKWKRKGAWKGGYFPKYDVIVAYHRAVLLARYEWQPRRHLNLPDKGLKGAYKVDVDVPANDWINVTTFYDVLVFNTGHWWGHDKFPKDTPLVFYRQGKPIDPPLDILDGLQVVLTSMVHYIEEKVPKKTLRFWRMQSPRHFYGGDWNQNGSCLFKEPLEENQLDAWFNPINGGVNREVREVNHLIRQALMGTDIQLLNLTYLSEFRADAHPAVWLGKKDAVAIWGQDCMHWCLPGVPDTWVDILAEQILDYFRIR